MYSVTDEVKGTISYTDKKRYLWLASVLMAALPLYVIGLYYVFDQAWILLTPLAIVFVLVPIFDVFYGEDATNPPEEIVPQLDDDPYYKRLLKLSVPIHWATLLGGALFVAYEPMSWPMLVGFSIMVGFSGGYSINTAHEIGHKTSKQDRRWAQWSLAVCGYGHFCVEHNLGHHRDVSTPEDSSSSRMGESLYAFMLREIPGALRRGLGAERDRLKKQGHSFWSPKNRILQSYTITLVVHGGLALAFGWPVLVFLLIHNGLAWFQLTCANYIEHYGLLREKLPNGRYEPCQPHHSWNANHILSNLMMFQLERHSDHHANPLRPYQSLRSFDDLPELPAGYFAMYLLAYFPPLWYQVMDRKLVGLPHIQGDFSKINVAPNKREELQARYA